MGKHLLARQLSAEICGRVINWLQSHALKRPAPGIAMKDDTTEEPEKVPTDWADLRLQAAKLGITLSQLQQQLREQELRRARKNGLRKRLEE